LITSLAGAPAALLLLLLLCCCYTAAAAATGQRKYFTVEASEMEPVFNEFMEHLYEVGCYIVTPFVTSLLRWVLHLVD
jgi:hypothetical protein